MGINGTDPQRGAPTPAAAVAAAFRAVEAADWARLVSLVHPDALENFKRQQLAWAGLDGMREELRAAPEPERANAEVDALPNDTPGISFVRAVFGVPDWASFEQLEPEVVLTRWFSVQRRAGARTLDQPRPAIVRTFLGEVPEGPDTMHLVFREHVELELEPSVPDWPRPDDNVRVISARRTEEGWKVLLNGGLVYDDAGGYVIGYDGGEEDAADT